MVNTLAKTWILSIPITLALALITWDWPFTSGVAKGTGYASFGFLISLVIVVFMDTLFPDD